jgi:UDP-GlcNAc:undecaprenyl-phosphate GlcNAc-1-phosphate transferase
MSQIVSFCLIFFISYLFSNEFLKILIKLSIAKSVFDNPNVERKIHKTPIPNIAGVAFFFTILFCMLIFSNRFSNHEPISKLLAASVIMFLLGLKDDLVGLSSSKRFYGQFFSGVILILLGDIRIQDLSLIGYSTISYPLSLLISLLFFVMITNAYNLIDGINGLLGSLTIFSCLCFSFIFYVNSNYFLLALTISIIGTTLSFLYFNFGNALIFMGSSGSYLIGAIMYFMSVTYLNQTNFQGLSIPRFSFLFSILAIPLYDTLRVFFLRILKKKSPFTADTNHIHHRLLNHKLSHTSVVFILLFVNMLLIIFNILMPKFNDFFSLILTMLVLIILNFILESTIKKN